MPSRRAGWMTRQGVSPRLAIRILVNMGLPHGPGRLAFFKEPRQTFPPFGRGADGGDPFGGVVDKAGIDGPVSDGENEVLGGALRGGTALRQPGQDGVHSAVELISRH